MHLVTFNRAGHWYTLTDTQTKEVVVPRFWPENAARTLNAPEWNAMALLDAAKRSAHLTARRIGAKR